MITVSKVSLDADAAGKLRAWLAKSEAGILRAVIQSKAKEKEVMALEQLLKNTDAARAQAKAEAEAALRYKSALDIIQEIAADKEPYTVTLS